MLERLSWWIVGSTELGGVSEPKSKCNQGNNGAHKSRSSNQQVKEARADIHSSNRYQAEPHEFICVLLDENC